MDIAASVVYITGASRGIGRACAYSLHHHGATVGLIARSRSELESSRRALGERVAAAVADVSDPDQLAEAMGILEKEIGPPDVLVNNAGVGAYAPVLDEDPSTFERLMRVNYLGTVHATRAVLPGMVERRRGHLVNIASVAGLLGAPFEAAYSASKCAVIGFSEAVAAEIAPYGIVVSLVNPGPVATGFTEARGVPFQRRFPRPLSPERIAAAVITAIGKGTFEQTLPRWLRSGAIVRSVAPGLYRRGLLRSFAEEAARRGPS